MWSDIVAYLAAPGSHALTLCIGGGLIYKYVVVPERKRADRLEEQLDEVFKAHRDALNRIAR